MTRKLMLAVGVISLLSLSFSSCNYQSDSKEWEERAADITRGCTTQYEKAKAIFDWQCMNIKYDYTYTIYHAREAWDARKGVCNAFSEMYVLLAKGCGLEAILIDGQARTLDYIDGKADHAWVRVKTERGWILLDATWGACELDFLYDGDTSLFSYEVGHVNGTHYEWFDVDPRIMIFTHSPTSKSDQLMSKPLSRDEYYSLPLLEPLLLRSGWDAGELLQYFLSHPTANPPYFYLMPAEYYGRLQFEDVPYSVEDGQGYTFVVESQSGEYFPQGIGEWSRDGYTYTCTMLQNGEEEQNLLLGINGLSAKSLMSYNRVRVRPGGSGYTKQPGKCPEGAPWVGIKADGLVK